MKQHIICRREPEDESNIQVIKEAIAKSQGIPIKDVTESLVVKVALQQVKDTGLIVPEETTKFSERNDSFAKTVLRRINKITTFGDGDYLQKSNGSSVTKDKKTLEIKKKNDIEYIDSRTERKEAWSY